MSIFQQVYYNHMFLKKPHKKYKKQKPFKGFSVSFEAWCLLSFFFQLYLDPGNKNNIPTEWKGKVI